MTNDRPNANDGATPRPPYAGLKLLALYAAGLFLLVVAASWNVEYMFSMSATLLVLPIISFAICKMWSRGLRCSRYPISAMIEGGAQEIRIALHQPYFSNLNAYLKDRLPSSVPSHPVMPVAVELAGSSFEFSYAIQPAVRGVYEVGPLTAGIHDPLGIVRLARRFETRMELVVYPRALPIEPWMLTGVGGEIGAEAIRAIAGGGSELYGTRKYYPGDDLRRVHWKSAARARELIVMEFAEDCEAGDVVIVLDTESGSDFGSGDETTLDYAARAAAYIAETVLNKGGQVSLITGAVSGGKAITARAPSELPIVLDALARAKADSDLSPAELLSANKSPAQFGAAFVVIGSKVTDSLRRAIAELVAAGVAVGQVFIDPDSFAGSGNPQKSGSDCRVHPEVPCWRVRRGEGQHARE